MRPFEYATIERITEDDLESLVANGVAESQELEFKGDIYVDMNEWRKDIAAMANTQGGCILIGVEADKDTGVATRIAGVDSDKLEQQIQQLERSADSNIEPHLLVKPHPIKLANGKWVIAAATPRSRYGPHAVRRNILVFYKRRGRTTGDMDLMELRRAFLASRTAEEEMLALHLPRVLEWERRADVILPQAFLALFPTPILEERFDPSDEGTRLVISNAFNRRIVNMDSGRLAFDGMWFPPRAKVPNEMRISRSGAVLAQVQLGTESNKIISLDELIYWTLSMVGAAMRVYEQLHVPFPISAFLAIAKCKDFQIQPVYPQFDLGPSEHGIDQSPLRFNRVLVESPPQDSVAILELLREWIDRVCHACNLASTGLFDPEGRANEWVKQALRR